MPEQVIQKLDGMPDANADTFLSSNSQLDEVDEELSDLDTLEPLPYTTFSGSLPAPTMKKSSSISNNRKHLSFLIAYLLVYFLLIPPTMSEMFSSLSTTTRDTEIHRTHRHISEIKVQTGISLDVKLDEDTDTCDIKSMAFSNDGHLIMTDYSNMEVKVFSRKGDFFSSLKLRSYPMGIAVVDSETAVVNCDKDIEQLHFLNISDPRSLSIKRSLSLQYSVTWLTTYNGKIIVTSWTETGSVKMIDLDGHVHWSISSAANLGQLFSAPAYLTTSVIHGKTIVIVTDIDMGTITLLDADTGHLIKQIDVNRTEPRGVTVDMDGNVYICYTESREIGLWRFDFRHSRILLAGKDLQRRPQDIVYQATENSILISYERNNKINMKEIMENKNN